MRVVIPLTVCVMLLCCTMVVPSADSAEQENCWVLFDYGNGNVQWSSVTVEDGLNAFNITLEAAQSLGIQVGYTESEFGVFIYSINNIVNQWPEEYWHFWIWNEESRQWELSMTGAGDTPAVGLSAIAWSYVKDLPDWSSEKPVATPDYKHPWSMFRHDLMNTGRAYIRGPHTSEIMWEKDLMNGAIDSGMVSANGRLYVVTSGIFNWTTYTHDSAPKIFCLDTAGEIIWEAEYSNAGYQLASPLLTDDMLIVPSTDGKIYAFDVWNGSQLWNYSTGFSYTGITSSPVLYRNQIIFGGGDGVLYAFNLNGTVAWSEYIASSIYFSSPAVRDGVIYIGSEDGLLHAVASDGSGEIWNVSVGGKVRSAPLLLDDMIVITYAVYDGFVAVDGGAMAIAYNGTPLWEVDLDATATSPVSTPQGIAVTSDNGLAMISTEGEILWNMSFGTPIKGSPAVSEDTLYLVTWSNHTEVIAVGFDGEVMWQTTLSPDSPDQYSMCSPIIADSILYVSADNGRVYAFGDIPPVASFTYEVDGLTIYLNASSSHDISGDLRYIWDFGDGNGSEGVSVHHEYAEAGNYTVTLTVIDDEGSQSQMNQTVSVAAPEPSGGGLTWWQIVILIVIIAVIGGAMYMTFAKGRE